MDEFDAIVNSRLASRKLILERVDEYTLYCFYLEIDDLIPGKPIHSPLREEDHPSFTIFYTQKGKGYEDVEFAWADKVTRETGNIFHLIKRLYKLNSFEEVYSLIAKDFELGPQRDIKAEKIVLYKKPPAITSKIRIHSINQTEKARKYWEQYHIGGRQLEKYIVHNIDYYWSYQEQDCPYSCLDPTFAYQIGAYYQIYSPHSSKGNKFRNDLPPSYFLGYLQLPPTGDVLVIDKSMKDIMFCDVLGYPAVSGKSETTPIPEKKMLELKERFKRIFLTLDPDEAGKQQTQAYVKQYPWLEPRFLTQAKDKTDLCKAVGFDESKRIITELLT